MSARRRQAPQPRAVTASACLIRTAVVGSSLSLWRSIAAAKASIIGVSLDSIARLKEFSAHPDYCGGKVPVASDASGRIVKSYDLAVREAKGGFKDTRGVEIDHGFAERTTFVVNPDGKIVATIGGLAPTKNVEKALEVVKQLAGGK